MDWLTTGGGLLTTSAVVSSRINDGLVFVFG